MPMMPVRAAALLLATALVISVAQSVGASDSAPLFETFGEGWESRWTYSSKKGYDGRFEAVTPEHWSDPGIKTTEKSKHYGLTFMLPEPFDLSKEGLVFQYEVKFGEGHTCGGAYIKLLSHKEGFKARQLNGDTPYSIMFGPDRCGPNNRVHTILRHTNPTTGRTSEHHLENPPPVANDPATHIYTLILTPDNKFEVLVDGRKEAAGNMLDPIAYDVPLQPPEVIPDPEDLKPVDWEDDDMMVDPTATKPDGWDDRRELPDEDAVKPDDWLDDEPLMIPDATASQPNEWDEEEDGAWAPPYVRNPKCYNDKCGPWRRPTKRNPNYTGAWMPPRIPNPKYKGEWEQKQIPNPAYFQNDAPLTHIAPIGAVAIEIWTIDQGYVFDGLYLGTSAEEAQAYRKEVWGPKYKAEADAREAELKDKYRPPGTTALLARVLMDAFDRPLLSWAKESAEPLLTQLKRHPALAWAVFATPVLVSMVLGLIINMRSGGADGVGAAKKRDLTGPDDDEEEVDEEDQEAIREAERAVAEARVEAAAAKTRAAAAAAAKAAAAKSGPAKKAAAQSEIQEQSEEESEEEEVVVKRRSRRA